MRPPFGGNPLKFGDEIRRQKTIVLGLPGGEKNHSFLRFDTIPARDGQTDGRTDGHVAVAITRASTVNGVTVTVYSANEGGWEELKNKKAVLPQGNRAMPQVFFSVEVRQQHSLQV